MSFISILFSNHTDQKNAQNIKIPPFFVDLNLDQVVNAITLNLDEYDLTPFFYSELNDTDAINYRHEVFHDLENPDVYNHVKLFSKQMSEVRRYFKSVEKFFYKKQKETWFLYAGEIYCDALKNFTESLSSSPLKSRGFLAFKEYLIKYIASSNFTSLEKEIKIIKSELAKVKYHIIVRSDSFTVQNYEEGIDYSSVIEKTFDKFRQGAVKDYRVEYKSSPADMNHIEAQILDFVAKLNPGLFSKLENFYTSYANVSGKDLGLPAKQASFVDETIADYDREVHFYIAYLEHIEDLKHENLQFCYPLVVDKSKEIYNYDGFDLALAGKLLENDNKIVCNDFQLKDKERIIVVTGPNQGGKTTFARTFGQLHYLANLGCLVPGTKSQLLLSDYIFTQFERAEKVENLRGKLEDDLKRVHSILDNATSQSIIIMNEIFNSTTLYDMTFLSKKVMQKIIELDLLCVWVTFVDELTLLSEKIVSMTSTVIPENPAVRTFKIVKRPADGLAYAMAIAEKYKLTYNRIKERIRP